MQINSKGIYESQPIAPYSSDNIFFTQNKKDKTIFAYYLASENEKTLPANVTIKNFSVAKGAKLSIFGSTAKLKWTTEGDGIKISIPTKLQQTPPGKYAWCFVIQP